MENQLKSSITLNKWAAFTDGQVKNRTLWYMASLVFQGVLCLPVPAALIFYYHAPVLCLAITVILFFANMVVGMCGSGIRTVIFFVLCSVAVNFGMLMYYIFR